MRKFDDVDELIATVKGNIQWVRRTCSERQRVS